MTITGTFEVNLQPLTPYADGIGRMSIDKVFRGDLEAVSKGEMLTTLTAVQGSAGYVAMEQVSGTLNGREGTFVLQHFGTMQAGQDRLILEVVPDSGMGELVGLKGEMQIIREDGGHKYVFTYSL